MPPPSAVFPPTRAPCDDGNDLDCRCHAVATCQLASNEERALSSTPAAAKTRTASTASLLDVPDAAARSAGQAGTIPNQMPRFGPTGGRTARSRVRRTLLVRCGVSPFDSTSDDPGRWLTEALEAVGATRVRHRRCHRDAFALGPPAARRAIARTLKGGASPKTRDPQASGEDCRSRIVGDCASERASTSSSDEDLADAGVKRCLPRRRLGRARFITARVGAVGIYPSPHSASSVASRLRRRSRPGLAGQWDFEGHRLPQGDSGLWARCAVPPANKQTTSPADRRRGASPVGARSFSNERRKRARWPPPSIRPVPTGPLREAALSPSQGDSTMQVLSTGAPERLRWRAQLQSMVLVDAVGVNGEVRIGSVAAVGIPGAAEHSSPRR